MRVELDSDSVGDTTTSYELLSFPARRTLTTATPAIFAGVTELYDLYLLHIYLSFGEVPLPDLLAAAQHPPGGGGMGGSGAAGDALTPRLRSTLLRIASDSIGKYRGLLGGQPGSKLAKSLVPRDPGAPAAMGGVLCMCAQCALWYV